MTLSDLLLQSIAHNKISLLNELLMPSIIGLKWLDLRDFIIKNYKANLDTSLERIVCGGRSRRSANARF